MERLDSFHEERIPAWITEWICYQPGASCGTGIERAPVSSVSIHSFLSMHVFSLVWIQCQQLIGRLEVGYTRKIGDVEKVVHRRNITVSTGCLCMPVDMQSFRQTESILRLLTMSSYQILDMILHLGIVLKSFVTLEADGLVPNPTISIIRFSSLKYTRIEKWHMQLSPFVLALGNILLTGFFEFCASKHRPWDGKVSKSKKKRCLETEQE